MRFTIIFLALIVFAAGESFACAPQEAEFGGAVEKVKVENGSTLFVVDSFTQWQESMLCPLFDVEVRSFDFIECTVTPCKLSIGQHISGYLSKDNDGKITYQP